MASQGAHAVTNNSVFYWSGNCEDCALEAGQQSYAVNGVLTLQDYSLGDDITMAHFQSFSYSGSNLVDPYSVVVGGDDGNPATNDYDASSIYYLQGRIDAVNGPNRFEIVFVDGLFFQTQVDASWSTCAPKGSDFYGGNSCGTFNPPIPADFGGNATFSTTPVPEPEAWAMLAAGLGLVAFMRRRHAALAAR